MHNDIYYILLSLISVIFFFILRKYRSIGYSIALASIIILLIYLTLVNSINDIFVLFLYIVLMIGLTYALTIEKELLSYIYSNYRGIEFLLIRKSLNNEKSSPLRYKRKMIRRRSDFGWFLILFNFTALFFKSNISYITLLLIIITGIIIVVAEAWGAFEDVH